MSLGLLEKQEGAEAPLALVVEDQPEVRGLSALVLRRRGFRVLEACDAAEAEAALGDAGGVALVLADVGLPGGVDGTTFAELALARDPDLRVVLVSGRNPDATALAEYRGRAVFLPKPFTPARLMQAIEGAFSATTAGPLASDPPAGATRSPWAAPAWLAEEAGGAEGVRSLSAELSASMTADLEAVRAAVREEKWDRAREVVHRLGGASLMFGAHRLADLCFDLQRSLGCGVGTVDLLAQVEGEVERVIAAIDGGLVSSGRSVAGTG